MSDSTDRLLTLSALGLVILFDASTLVVAAEDRIDPRRLGEFDLIIEGASAVAENAASLTVPTEEMHLAVENPDSAFSPQRVADKAHKRRLEIETVLKAAGLL